MDMVIRALLFYPKEAKSLDYPLIKVEMAGTFGGGPIVCSFHHSQPNPTVVLFIYTVSKSMPALEANEANSPTMAY